MQDTISLIFLGLVQGLTEFLPVSSTGHLILAREFFGFGTTGLGLAEDAVLHLATALAVAVYFRKDIFRLVVGAFNAITKRSWNKEMTVISALFIGTIPAVIAGLWFESAIETVLRDSLVVAGGLIVGSGIFLLAERVHKKISEKGEMEREVSIGRGLIIGLFQVLALVPGMSRSGMTISGGMLLGLTRVEAARFAFLLAFQVIVGAGSLKLVELLQTGSGTSVGIPLALGALAAFASGMFAIHTLITLLKTRTLMPFVIYRLVLAAIILVVAL